MYADTENEHEAHSQSHFISLVWFSVKVLDSIKRIYAPLKCENTTKYELCVLNVSIKSKLFSINFGILWVSIHASVYVCTLSIEGCCSIRTYYGIFSQENLCMPSKSLFT